jgi:hypothetical protein
MHCFGQLYDQMTMQRPRAQGFDSLGCDLLVAYLEGLSLQLQKPLVEIGTLGS